MIKLLTPLMTLAWRMLVGVSLGELSSVMSLVNLMDSTLYRLLFFAEKLTLGAKE